MTADPRAALDRLIAALEAHYQAVVSDRGEEDSSLDDAYEVLADAFEVYDDALETVHGESTPFALVEDDAEDEDEDEDGEDEDDLDTDDDTVDDVDVDEEEDTDERDDDVSPAGDRR